MYRDIAVELESERKLFVSNGIGNAPPEVSVEVPKILTYRISKWFPRIIVDDLTIICLHKSAGIQLIYPVTFVKESSIFILAVGQFEVYIFECTQVGLLF